MSQAASTVQTPELKEDRPALADYLTIAFDTSQTPTSVHLLDTNVLVAANDAFCTLVGRKREQVIGCSMAALGLSRSNDDQPSSSHRPSPDQMTPLSEQPVLHSGGWTLTCAVNVYPAVFADQRCLVSTYRDLSSEIQIRKTQGDHRCMVEAAISAISDGVCIVNADGSVAQVNSGFLRLHGLLQGSSRTATLAELRTGFDVFTPEGVWVPPSARPPARANRGESGSGEEVVLVSRITGRECHCIFNFSPIYGEGGEVLGVIIVTRDIGDEIVREQRALAQRLDLERLISERTAELAAATRAAESANAAKTQFISHVSHELRTPLHSIATIASLLRNRPGATEPGIVEALEAATNHLIGLIDKVLDLKQIEAGHSEVGKHLFNLNHLIADVVAITRDQAWEKGLQLTYACDVDDIALIGDPQRIKQALLNYVGNAIKFTQQGCVAIHSSCQRESGDQILLRFEVKDTGPGIEGSELRRVFKPFERIHSAVSGSGLGLAITQRLAHSMGGDVGATSQLNVGSVFWFTARVRSASPKQPSSALSTTPVPQSGAMKPKHRAPRVHTGPPKGQILLVEDDPISRGLLSQLLAHWGFEVDTAADGIAALERASAVDYQLILMDMQMPGMDGPSAAVEINARRQGRWRPPILALTANAFDHDRQRCVAAGMSDFISKPISPELLFERLEFWRQAESRRTAVGSV